MGFLPLQAITGINCLFRKESTSAWPYSRKLQGVALALSRLLGVARWVLDWHREGSWLTGRGRYLAPVAAGIMCTGQSY
jgi:hypothetical protein